MANITCEELKKLEQAVEIYEFYEYRYLLGYCDLYAFFRNQNLQNTVLNIQKAIQEKVLYYLKTEIPINDIIENIEQKHIEKLLKLEEFKRKSDEEIKKVNEQNNNHTDNPNDSRRRPIRWYTSIINSFRKLQS